MGNTIFWLYMFICLLLIPLVMIIFGTIFRRAAPKKINPLFGYRSEQSMKDKESWDFAHKQVGSIWRRWGFAMLISIVPMFFVYGKDVDTVSYWGLAIIVLQLIVMIIPIFIVEKRLKNFNKNRKEE